MLENPDHFVFTEHFCVCKRVLTLMKSLVTVHVDASINSTAWIVLAHANRVHIMEWTVRMIRQY